MTELQGHLRSRGLRAVKVEFLERGRFRSVDEAWEAVLCGDLEEVIVRILKGQLESVQGRREEKRLKRWEGMWCMCFAFTFPRCDKETKEVKRRVFSIG